MVNTIPSRNLYLLSFPLGEDFLFMEDLSTSIQETLLTPDLAEVDFDNFEAGSLFEDEARDNYESAINKGPYVGPEWRVTFTHFGYIDNNTLYLNNEEQKFGDAKTIIESLEGSGIYDSKFSDIETRNECLARYTLEAGLVKLTIYEAGPSGVIEDAPEVKEIDIENFESYEDDTESDFDNSDYQTENNIPQYNSRVERSAEMHHYTEEPMANIETSSQFQREREEIAKTTGIRLVFNPPAEVDADPIFPEEIQIATESRAIN